MAESSPLLTVIVPVFNEEDTVDQVLSRLREAPYAYPDQQVVVVDDGSTDRTPNVLEHWAGTPGVVLLRHPRNRGKGAAVRTGLARASGLVTVIHDADLEYDPADLAPLVEPILARECDAVYGSRYLRPDPSLPWTRFRAAVSLMNGIVRTLYGTRLTDVATCYKALTTELYRHLDLQAERFEFCSEVTAKLCRLGVRIKELPIAYHPRTKQEGKKIGWRDAISFAWSLCAWRFSPLSWAGEPKPLYARAPPALDAGGPERSPSHPAHLAKGPRGPAPRPHSEVIPLGQ